MQIKYSYTFYIICVCTRYKHYYALSILMLIVHFIRFYKKLIIIFITPLCNLLHTHYAHKIILKSN